MLKITYHYSALSKQTWFYAGMLYLALLSVVYILVAAYHVEGYYEDMNLTLNLLANAAGMAFFYLLSLGHHVCYSEYDGEKITYHNRLLRKSRTFRYDDAQAVIFDRRGIKFYKDEQALINKEEPDFYVPFFRDGKVEAVQLNGFFKMIKDREERLAEDYEEEEEKSNIKKSEGCGCALLAGVLIFLLVAGIVFLYSVGVFDKKSSSSSSQTSGVDNVVDSIVYRNLENGDFTISDNNGDLTTRIVITIQANTDIKEFSASIYLYDEDKNVIDSQNVSYSNMASGSRYEVVFNLSLSEMWNLDSYEVKNIRGKVRK